MKLTLWSEKAGSRKPTAQAYMQANKPIAKPSSSIIPHLSANLLGRAAKTFDRASIFIVMTVWAAAFAFMALAYVGVEQTIKARKDVAEAEAASPVLPTINQEPIPAPSLQQLADRLKKRMGDKVVATPSGSQMRITASMPENYNLWLSAIAYVDSMSADTQWSIRQFCVGQECKDGLMSVTLDAQKVSFTTPSTSE